MIILIISQRIPPNNKFNLKDLPGHGRLDILARCILAACRPMASDITDTLTVYCFLKGGEETGWIIWNTVLEQDDEISIASKLKTNWDQIFTQGSLDDLKKKFNDVTNIILLSENGQSFSNKLISKDCLFVLGAQKDLTEDDISTINPTISISLSSQPMLASHAIIKLRQDIKIKQFNVELQ